MLYSCITAASQSVTSYTAVYAGVGTFVVTALMGVIIDYFDSNVIMIFHYYL
jgi:fucose permease